MSAQTIEINGKKISIPTGLFINGEFRKGQAGKTFEDVDDAVKTARKTFKSKEWSEYGATNRARLLNKLADVDWRRCKTHVLIVGKMEEHFDELVAIEMLDTGKTHQQASTLDVPTIFTDVKPHMKIMREEIFGPVVAIAKFKDEEEVLELANDTTYGLAAGIFTKDYERAIRVTGALKAGTTWVNLFNFVHWSMPFGGYKESGIGRECGDAALENYTETKTVYFNMGMAAPPTGSRAAGNA
ncbi:hypothetical protein LTR86_004181 [Recurvomyces mirabilis]|nr:hypothetical protein LTR86_004181 [Recurvomyces mirabilis]